MDIGIQQLQLGKGNLTLEEMIKLDKEYEVEVLILEQHKSFVEGDLYKSIKESLNYLKEKLFN